MMLFDLEIESVGVEVRIFSTVALAATEGESTMGLGREGRGRRPWGVDGVPKAAEGARANGVLAGRGFRPFGVLPLFWAPLGVAESEKDRMRFCGVLVGVMIDDVELLVPSCGVVVPLPTARLGDSIPEV